MSNTSTLTRYPVGTPAKEVLAGRRMKWTRKPAEAAIAAINAIVADLRGGLELVYCMQTLSSCPPLDRYDDPFADTNIYLRDGETCAGEFLVLEYDGAGHEYFTLGGARREALREALEAIVGLGRCGRRTGLLFEDNNSWSMTIHLDR